MTLILDSSVEYSITSLQKEAWEPLGRDWWGMGPWLLSGVPEMNDVTHIYTQTRPTTTVHEQMILELH